MSFVWAILVFTLVVVIHEYGHYLLARRAGIKVIEFSVGMGPRLFHRTGKNGVMFSWKLFPIGGSCMMLGEDEKLDDPDAFGSKSVWARMSVILAGPFFNFILAFLFSLFVVGFGGIDPAYITSSAKGSPAAEAGMQVGDKITKVNKSRIYIGREMSMYLQLNPLSDEEVFY